MDKGQIDKSYQELKFEKIKNRQSMAVSSERRSMSEFNTTEKKIKEILGFSIIPYMGLFLTSFLGFETNFIANIFPGITYPIALIGSSLTIGVLIKNILDKQLKIKESIKAFSTSKTEAEKLEEQIQYEIEFEKTKNRNKVLDEAINILGSEQKLIEEMFGKYEVVDMSLPKTQEEALEREQKLTLNAKKQYEELDILTTQKVLYDKLFKPKSQTIKEIIGISSLSGLGTYLFTVFLPALVVKDIILASSIMTAFILPIAIGTVGGLTYLLKRNKDYKKVFNNLNSKLGKNALSNENKKIEDFSLTEKEFKIAIENKIRDIGFSEVQLKKNERYLDTFTTDAVKKEDMLFKDFPQLHITEATKKEVLEHPERYVNSDVRTHMGMFYTDEEREQYIEESLNRPLPGGKEKGPTLVKRKKNSK